MMNQKEIFETNEMIEKENLDVRTITMGISLFDCASEDPAAFGQKIYDKICRQAENLVKVFRLSINEFPLRPLLWLREIAGEKKIISKLPAC